MNTRFPFSTALVTGASSGIGRELARQLGAGGVRVALCARRKPELQSAAEEIARSGGPPPEVIVADLSRPDEAFRTVAEAEARLGRIDLLVCNAGVGSNGPVAGMPWELMEAMVRVNTLAPMALIRAALPPMLERGSGTIAGISSLASYRGLPGSGPYSASKAALSTFLEAVRVESRRRGVAVVDIHPGYVRTPMTSTRQEPMMFLMEVEDAARLILRAIVRRTPVYDLPWQMGLLLRAVRLLPAGVFDRLASARGRA
jgi:short-subunit dehydrogenase